MTRPDTEIYQNELQDVMSELKADSALNELAHDALGPVEDALKKLRTVLYAPLLGARGYGELAEALGIGKNEVARLLKLGKPEQWQRLLERVSIGLLIALLHWYNSASEATRSRWRPSFGVDDSTLKKFARRWGLVGVFYSGSAKQTIRGLNVLVLYVSFGDGPGALSFPVMFCFNRQKQEGHPGRPPSKKGWQRACELIGALSDKLRTAELDLEGHWLAADTAFLNEGFADFARSLGMRLVSLAKSTYVFRLEKKVNGPKRLEGAQLLAGRLGKWRRSDQLPNLPYQRWELKHGTLGPVVLALLKEPSQRSRRLMIALGPADLQLPSVPTMVRAWRRRWPVETCFQICKHDLSLERHRGRSKTAQTAHVSLTLLLYLLLRVTCRWKFGGTLTPGRIVREYRLIGIRTVYASPDFQALLQARPEKVVPISTFTSPIPATRSSSARLKATG